MLFFCFKQKTAYEMLISDWSSDVCSSDLQDMRRLAGFSLLVSSGTLLAAIGTGQPAATGSLLFYLVASTLGIGAFFLLIELVERGREAGADMLAVTMEAYGEDEEEALDEEDEAGVAIPATMAILGVSFVCCALLIAGLPPLPGFIEIG